MMATKYSWMVAVKGAWWVRTWDARCSTPGQWEAFMKDLDAADAAYAKAKAAGKSPKRTRFFIM